MQVPVIYCKKKQQQQKKVFLDVHHTKVNQLQPEINLLSLPLHLLQMLQINKNEL